MKRATPRFSAATFMSIFGCRRLELIASRRPTSAPCRRGSPSTSGVLPSSDTSDASIFMWRHAGLSTARLFDAVDVGLHRAAAPRLAARRQLEVDAAFRSAADAAAAARRLRPGLADQRVDVLEEVGMILDELAHADVHALLVAFGDEDDVHRQLAGDRLDRHQRVPLRHLRPLASWSRRGRSGPSCTAPARRCALRTAAQSRRRAA